MSKELDFHIKLTEEKAKKFTQNFEKSVYELGEVERQIRAQLPKEKKYKFLVGYYAKEGSAKDGGLNTVPYILRSQEKIYGFTEEQLVRFRMDAFEDDGHDPQSPDATQRFVRKWLATQEAE